MGRAPLALKRGFMTSVFLFGTMCHAPLFELVSGAALAARPAQMRGKRAVWVAGQSYPMLVEAEEDCAEGLLVDLDAHALDRLDFYEACFGYHRQPVEIDTETGPALATAWMPATPPGDPGAPWSLAEWAADWGELSVVAAREVMLSMGKDAPEEVGRRFWMIRARAQSYLTARSWRRPGRVGVGLTLEDVRIDEVRHPYTSFFTVEEFRAQFRQFAGGWSDPVDRAMFRVADAVTVLPYYPKRDRILLIEQARFGALAHGDAAPWLLEPIAGMIDAGETPETSARREAVEEAGLTLGALHFVARYYPSPGGIAQVLFSYVAEADLPDDITGINGADYEYEDIHSHVVSFDEAMTLLKGGDMANAPLILSFQWLMMHRARLRSSG